MSWDKAIGRVFNLFVCTILALPAYGQSMLTVPYSLEDGLVQSQVTEIYQDSQGYMWFGTYGGLSRFDGIQFTNYTVAEGLASNRVFGLAEDAQGRIWIGTPKGIQLFDGTSFMHLTTEDGLLSDEIYDLMSLPSGEIWIASNGGLSFFNGETFSHITEVDGLVSPFVISLALDGEGNLWAGTAGGACVLIDLEPTCYTTAEGLPHNTVSALLVDQRNRVWAGTPRGAALLLSGGENGRFITLDYLPQQRISGFLEDQDGAIWLSNRQGFYRLGQGMSVKDHWDDGEWIGSSMFQDREGTIWAGTYGRGVVQFRPTAFTNQARTLELPEDVYLSMYEDTDGSIWAGSRMEGLFHIEGGNVTHYDRQTWPFLNHVRSIRRGPDGDLWLATAEGAVRYDTNGFRHFSNLDGLFSPYSFSILPDSNEVTWVANMAGLFKIEQDVVSSVTLPFDNGGKTIHTLEQIGNRIWAGAEQGLLFIEQDSVYYIDALRDTPVTSIAPLPSGRMWLGTMGMGLYLYDPAKGAVIDSVTTSNGLTSGNTYFVEVDQTNTLWVGTNKGIDKVVLNAGPSGKDKVIKGYGQKDGIVGVETNKNASMIDQQGRLWFGTLKSVMQFNAADEPHNSVPPPVYLTDVQLYLESFASADSLQQGGFSFEHNENHLTFHFLGLSFIAPDHVSYQYRMNGFDKDWSPLTPNRFATYSNLSPGDYAFEVRAINSDGVWSVEPASISFFISPPFWETNWFRGSAAAGLLLLIITIVQVRTFTIKKRSNQLQVMVQKRTTELETTHTALLEAREDALQAARTRSAFLSAMTHELRTPMNGIMGMAQLLNFTELDEEQIDYSVTILESSNAMLDMIENLLTFADLAAGKHVLQEEVFNVKKLLQDALAPIKARVKKKDLEIFIRISPALSSEIKADREHISQIIKHLLSNAIKFTDLGLIYINIDKRAKRTENEVTHELVVAVHDTGIGIEKSKLAKIFDSFTQLDMTTTRSFEGTGIGLTLARHMSTLLGGKLFAESKPGVGSSFYLSVPLHEIHQQLSAKTDTPEDKLRGKKVMIILQSERERRRLALICKSMGMSLELAKPSALFGSVEDFDLILSETLLDNENIEWFSVEELLEDEPLFDEESILGIEIEPDIKGNILESAVRIALGDEPTNRSSDFHKDFGNPLPN